MKISLLTALGLSMIASLAHSAPKIDVLAELQNWNHGKPGGIAVAWVDSEGTKFYQTGQFDNGDPRAITADTQFEIGSVSKVFTGLLLAESELSGRVKRDDPAAKFLLPPGDSQQTALAKITLVSLATHSSGLPRLPTNMSPASASDPYADYTRENLVVALKNDGDVAPVGLTVAYSNFGVGVLGEALAVAWRTSYEDALTLKVLKPLKLANTQVAIAGNKQSEMLAPGHAGEKRVGNWNFAALAPAGALRSTPRDMARFLSSCLGFVDSPLKLAIAESLKPVRETSDFQGHIALNWFITGEGESRVIWHNGMTGGYASWIGFCPSTKQGVAILTNHAVSPDGLGFRLLGVSSPKPLVKTVEAAADYVGRYPLTPNFALDITEAGGVLFVQATGQGKLALRKSGGDRFAIVGVPAELSFERNPEGNVIAAVLHQNGKTPRGLREALPTPVERKELTLTMEALGDYVGVYELQPGVAFVVTLENGTLLVQLSSQPAFPIFASSIDEFYYKVVDAQLSFKRDANGKVVSLILHQNGQNLPARKQIAPTAK